MSDENSIHHGHRKRTKSAMLENGIDGLNNHQILEILLFYVIPKRDTNPIAHELVNRFGSLRGVLEADYNELVEVNGIGENAASLIKFAQMLSRRYLCDSSFDNDSQCFDDTDILRRYYEAAFLGVKNEQIRAMLLDDKLFMVKEKVILDGSISKVECDTRKIIDFVIKNDCDKVVIAHNHPNGSPLPSLGDVASTKILYKKLKVCDISLVDHVIVGKTGSTSLRSYHHGFGVWPDGSIKDGISDDEAADDDEV